MKTKSIAAGRRTFGRPRRRTLGPSAGKALLPAAMSALLLLPGALVGQQKAGLDSIEEALQASAILAGRRGPASVNWIDGGERFSFTTRNPATNREEIRAYDPKSLQDQRILEGPALTLPGTGEPFEYRSFQWSQDSKFLVFQNNFRKIYRRSGISDFYVYSLAKDTLQLAAAGARTAELSPDGHTLGYERDGDMFVFDLASKQEKQISDSPSTDSVFDGHFDWVYEEEFGQAQAWKWSPDSRHIAFWRTDEHGVPWVHLSDYRDLHPEWVTIPIPLVGDPNPTVKIGVADVATGRTTWLDAGVTDGGYIPRIYWTSSPDTLAVMTLDRAQNHVQVFFFDVKDGGRRKVFDETSDTWLDVYDFYAGVDDMIYFPPGMREFFWVSDRDGHQHVYRYGYDGKLKNQVTKGDWTVTRVEGIDPKSRTVYFTSTEASPLQRQVYSVRFDGSGKRRLTKTEGNHRIDMSPNTKYYIDTWSNTETPRQVELWSTAGGGRKLATLEDNASVSAWLDGHQYSPLEMFHFTTSDGATLDGSMIKPPDMEAGKRYPVLFSIYGGPGSQQVYDAFATNGWDQYLAQHGFIVVGLNNRGTANYSRDFMKVVYEHLGKYESRDFAEAAKYLATLPYVDGDHMAIQGTSYGGYSTIYTMLMYPDVFRLGIANSGVTDFRLYDSIYTERYMGLLSDNLGGYVQSAATTHADSLKGHLLMVHSMMDDNVHPVNTMQMLTAFGDAGKDVEVRFYPPGAHGASYSGTTYLLMTKVYTEELEEYLK